MNDMWRPQHIDSRILLNLLYQYTYYSIELHVVFFSLAQGIYRGCTLSPLMGGSYLYDLDCALNTQ